MIDSKWTISIEITGFRGFHFSQRWISRRKEKMYEVPGSVLSIPRALKVCHYLHFTAKETEGYIRCEKGGQRRVLDHRGSSWYLAGKWHEWNLRNGTRLQRNNTLSLVTLPWALPGSALYRYGISWWPPAGLHDLQSCWTSSDNEHQQHRNICGEPQGRTGIPVESSYNGSEPA